MAWDARQIILCANPSAKILSPSFHVNTASTFFTTYSTTSINAPAGSIGGCSWNAATVTGAMTYDIVNEHMRGTTSNNTDPTQVIAAYNAAVSAMGMLGILSRPLWNDEFGCNGIAQCLNQDNEAAYVAIEYVLLASFSNPAIGNADWYSWDGSPVQLQAQESATAYDVVYSWLVGSTVNNYSLSGTIYSITGTTPAGQTFKITFDTSQNCATLGACTTAQQPEPGFSSYYDLTNTNYAVNNDEAPVGLKPIMLMGSF
jgi:hypothetical protein